MSKLTNVNQSFKRKQISSHLSSPFIVCFKYKLYNGYDFTDLKNRHLREFQKFLNHVSDMTFQQVEITYRRKSDSSDVFDDEQIIHYGFGDKFRIHGIIEDGRFVVLRLDPEHKFHN